MADQSLLDALARHDFGSWQQQNPGKTLDLSNVELSDRIHLPSDLRGANLCNSTIPTLLGGGFDFRGANLNGARFGSWVHYNDGTHQQDHGQGAFFLNANFDRALLCKAKFCRAQLHECSFRGVDAAGADFAGASLTRCDFSDAVLGAPIARIDPEPQGRVLDDGRRFIPDQWSPTMADSQSSFRDAHLVECVLDGARMDGADFHGSRLMKCSFRECSLVRAWFVTAQADECRLDGAKLCGCNMGSSRWNGASFERCDLRWASLHSCDLGPLSIRKVTDYSPHAEGTVLRTAQELAFPTTLRGALLTDSDMRCANLVRVDLRDAILTGSQVYGASVWDAQLDGATQTDLVLNDINEPEMRVDSLAVAHFVRLIMADSNLRQVLDTVSRSVVLVLGRFSEGGSVHVIQQALRKAGYLPVLFTWQAPDSKSLNETVDVLARLSRFVVVDLSDPRSSPHETAQIAGLDTIPVLPTLIDSQEPYAMFESVSQRKHVLQLFKYSGNEDLQGRLPKHIRDVVEPAVDKLRAELAASRARIQNK